MKFKPENHTTGKVYDLTQENMQEILNHLDDVRNDYYIAVDALKKIKEADNEVGRWATRALRDLGEL